MSTCNFANRLDVVPSTAGLHLAARLRVPVDIDALVARAAGGRLRRLAGCWS